MLVLLKKTASIGEDSISLSVEEDSQTPSKDLSTITSSEEDLTIPSVEEDSTTTSINEDSTSIEEDPTAATAPVMHCQTYLHPFIAGEGEKECFVHQLSDEDLAELSDSQTVTASSLLH